VTTDAVRDASTWIPGVERELSRVIVGHEHLVERLLIALLADGHVLLEGGPGLGKRLVVQSFAAALGCDFRHLDCTPDLERADAVGTWSARGPLFAHVLYAAHLDQAPPKVQTTLIGAAQDREVRLGNTLLPLPEPFLLFASCPPAPENGACGLTLAQRDRFLLKVAVRAPDAGQERILIDVASPGLGAPEIRAVTDPDRVRRARRVLPAIHMDGRVKDYVVRLVHAARRPARVAHPQAGHLRLEASPRATLGLVAAAKGRAFLDGRGAADVADVRAVAPDVLCHRVETAPDSSEREGPTSADFIQRILDAVPLD
jgi:MoxR-like ATPase